MKILGSLIATAALAFSALVAVPTTATAAPYPGTVTTTAGFSVPSSVKKNKALNIAYRVYVKGSNAKPSGTVKIRVYKVASDGGRTIVRGFTVSYTGPGVKYKSLGKYSTKGKYTSRLFFTAKSGSVYKNKSTQYHDFKVN